MTRFFSLGSEVVAAAAIAGNDIAGNGRSTGNVIGASGENGEEQITATAGGIGRREGWQREIAKVSANALREAAEATADRASEAAGQGTAGGTNAHADAGVEFDTGTLEERLDGTAAKTREIFGTGNLSQVLQTLPHAVGGASDGEVHR